MIRAGGDGDDEMRGLPRVPFQPAGDLQDGDAVLFNQMLILAQAVRDGDPGAEEGVRHGFALHHAGFEGRLDAAGGD